MATAEEIGSLDVDVVGLVDLDFKSEADFFDFDSGGDYGLFGEAGVALHTTASASTSTSSHPHPTTTSSHHTNTPTHSKKTPANKMKNQWNEFEKDLFLKGLDLFGADWGRISSFIATKTPGQVRNFHKKWAETASVVQETDTFDDHYIYMPAEPVCITTDIEDPQGLLETATTTVITTPLSPKRRKRESSDSEPEKTNIDALNFRTAIDDVFVPSIGQEWVVETCDPVSEKKTRKKSSPTKRKNTSPHKTKKIKSPLKIKPPLPFKLKSEKKVKKKKKHKKSMKREHKYQDQTNIVSSQLSGRPNKSNNVTVVMEENTGIELGQVVHIVKDDIEESDVDIDISDEEQLMIVDNPSTDSIPVPLNENNENTEDTKSTNCTETKDNTKNTSTVREVNRNDAKKQQIFNFPAPTEEVELDMDSVTEDEKRVHFEYFDGRGVKTPERYLKIRNYLVSYWKQIRPNYVRKTAVRSGLKNCGDVNSIGKVHEYLEKIGAINFGCQESNYSSPLVVGVKPKEKLFIPNKPAKVDRSDMARQKQKKKWDVSLCEGGGLTISHDESGAVVDACHIPEAPRVRPGAPTGQGRAKSEQFKLVRCLEHDPDTRPPFSVIMHAHSLITLDLHAHTSLAEVMGLLGGYYDPIAQTLHVTVAVPTRAVSSGVECDMCPISQSAACTVIHEGGVQVVGWYHSHPTFPPNPSIQDLDTQDQMQRWFARQDAPFLGIIISPFCPTNRSEASQIRCIVLDKPPHTTQGTTGGASTTVGTNEAPTQPVPYKLSWCVSELVPGAWEEVCQGVRKVVVGARDDPLAVEWRGEWRGQATNWEKAISSLTHHLPKHFSEPFQTVRSAFLSAVRECMDS